MTDGPPTWLGPIRQTAFIVDDLDAAMQRWLDETGAGPWFVFDVDVEDATYRGERVRLRSRTALAQSGGQQIELIEPDLSVGSVYKEHLDAGRAGVHHICYWADLDRAGALLESRGNTLVQAGTTPNGVRFEYWTGTIDAPYIELVDPRPGDGMSRFFAAIAAAAENWDGRDPVRQRR